MQLADETTVRPFLPNRFVGKIAYSGATDIHVAAIAVHEGRAIYLNLVGHDTGCSAVLSRMLLGEQLQFIPAGETRWDGPELISRPGTASRMPAKRLPGLKRMSNQMFISSAVRIQFNLQQAPDIPAALMVKKEADAEAPAPTVLAMPGEDPQAPPQWRYVCATEGSMPSSSAFLGTLIGMRAIVLRPRQSHLIETSRAWAHALWRAGQAHNLIQPLHTAGIAVWAVRSSVLHWNALISQGVAERWLPAPHQAMHLPPAQAIAAD